MVLCRNDPEPHAAVAVTLACARLTVNFLVANIIFVLDRPPLSQDMSAIKLLIATLKSKGIAI